MSLKDKRKILQHSQHLRHEEVDVDVYIATRRSNISSAYSGTKEILQYQVFKGNTQKPVKEGFSNISNIEDAINKVVQNALIQKNNKASRKLESQKAIKVLRQKLVPGVLVRTSYSYNMTFNKFYKAISNKGNKYQLRVLQTEWADPDNKNIGWYGDVKAGSSTGEIIEGKLTASGLKIDRLYGHIINKNDTFYENRLD